jgi:hypothetical protein
MAETHEALRARYEELRDKEDATWQAWRILNRSRNEAFDAWAAATRPPCACNLPTRPGSHSAEACGLADGSVPVPLCNVPCMDAGNCADCKPANDEAALVGAI